MCPVYNSLSEILTKITVLPAAVEMALPLSKGQYSTTKRRQKVFYLLHRLAQTLPVERYDGEHHHWEIKSIRFLRQNLKYS